MFFLLLHGAGGTVGAALVAQPGVAGVVFTGSTQVAKIIQRALAAKDGPIVPLIADGVIDMLQGAAQELQVGNPADLATDLGPLLQVVRWDGNPEDVIAQINALGYGLTLGIQTRIDSRAQALAAQAHVGNIYINRNMIGAVVGVQPFGGEGLSGTGPKAGGPHYLYRFCAEQTVTVNTTAAGGNAALLASMH